MDAHFDPQRMPVDAVTYLEKHEVPGPMLSPDYWGGYLIYRLYPKAQVVVDDRHDLYGEKFLKSYLKMVHGEPGWQEFLSGHEVSCLLLPQNAALANILLETPEWKPIYTDKLAIAFVRSSSAEREPRWRQNAIPTPQSAKPFTLTVSKGPYMFAIPHGIACGQSCCRVCEHRGAFVICKNSVTGEKLE